MEAIRKERFCPIVVFSSAIIPESIAAQPFVKHADKANVKEIAERVEELMATGVLQAVWRIHDDIERGAGSYLWHLLNTQWETLCDPAVAGPAVLERIIRRRASIQIGRLNPDAEGIAEAATVEGAEFYIYPPVSDSLRLGDVLRNRNDRTFCVALTPHCHLVTQPEATGPRADHVLIVVALPAKETIAGACVSNKGKPQPPWTGDGGKDIETLRRRVGSPADLGKPNGRYWFLPGFLDIPDLYCDLLQLHSIPYDEVDSMFERVATLDAPFAEALQTCFTKFYLAVGLPNLDLERLKHLG